MTNKAALPKDMTHLMKFCFLKGCHPHAIKFIKLELFLFFFIFFVLLVYFETDSHSVPYTCLKCLAIGITGMACKTFIKNLVDKPVFGRQRFC